MFSKLFQTIFSYNVNESYVKRKSIVLSRPKNNVLVRTYSKQFKVVITQRVGSVKAIT